MILHWFNDGINNTQVKMDKYFLQKILNNKCRMEDFPGGPVARTLCSHAGAWVWSLVGELRSCRLHDVGKYINEEWTKEIKNYCRIPQWLSAVRKICLRIFKFSGWNFKEKQDICVASKCLLQKYLLTALVVRTHVHKYLDTCSSRNWTEVAQSCPTLWDPTDYSLPSSSVHRIFQARVLEWVAIFFFFL